MEKKIPFTWTLVPVVSLVIILIATLQFFDGDPHMALFLAAIIAALVAFKFGYKWETIEKGIVKMLKNTLPSMLIFCIIGMVIGTWILAGIVPIMIYYGLNIVSPKFFLVTACVISSIISLSTGSSWTTVGTVGIALIGMGQGLNIPLPMVAGAIISGAYFGDKMSPLSDTTNLAPAAAGSELFEHIIHMMYTTGPSIIITLIIYTIIGLRFGNSNVEANEVAKLLSAIEAQFTLSPILLLPPIAIVVIVIKKVPAIPGLTAGVLLGILLAYFIQGATPTEIISSMHYGYISETGYVGIDDLLTRGGLDSMMWPLSLVFMSLSYAGIMESSGMIRTIADTILKYAKSVGALILSTELTCIGVNVLTGDQYLSIVFTGEMYKTAYKEKGLHSKNLSRTLEDSGTITSPLIPWNACAVFMSATLGVATLSYLPFAFFNLINPIIAAIYGYTGFSIEKIEEKDKKIIS